MYQFVTFVYDKTLRPMLCICDKCWVDSYMFSRVIVLIIIHNIVLITIPLHICTSSYFLILFFTPMFIHAFMFMRVFEHADA